MIDQIETGAENVLGVRVTGKVTEEDIDATIGMLEEKLSRFDRVSFAAEIGDLDGISPAALMKDISYGVQQLKNLDRFDRAAVISDKRWVRAAAKLEGRLLPGVKVRSFRRKEREEALSWVNGEAA